MSARRAAVVVLAALVLLAGCGVPLQEEPQVVDRTRPTAATRVPSAESGPAAGTVYLVRGERVVPVQRRLSSTDGTELLHSLFEGPSDPERRAGLRSAIPPGLPPARVALVGNVATVELPEQLTELDSPDHVLAVAQIVYTLTDTDGARSVQMTRAGVPTPAPAGDGRVVDRPLTRTDFLDRAPVATPESPATPNP